MAEAPVALCVSGQMRTLVTAKLHTALRTNVIEPLPADSFLSLDLQDTRLWGMKQSASRTDYEVAIQVLQPVAHELVSLSPPDLGGVCSSAGSMAPGGGHVCQARDCGTFHCGCYMPMCTHCEVAKYMPMHEHNARCLAMITSHEDSQRTNRYTYVMKVRPDLYFPFPLPPLSALSNRFPPASSTSFICTIGGSADPIPLKGASLDDKWAIAPRNVAELYSKASDAFASCASRANNSLTCGQPTKSRLADPQRASSTKRPLRTPGTRKMVALGPSSHRGLPDSRSRPTLSMPGYKPGLGNKTRSPSLISPYWATPQCILGRWLTDHAPNIVLVRCLQPHEWPILVRPELGKPLRVIPP